MKQLIAVWHFLHTHFLETIVLITGIITMILEVLGLSIIASTFGNALTVSSNLVGIILLGLSGGYYFGGKWADKTTDPRVFSGLLLGAGAYIGIIFTFQNYISLFIRFHIADVAGGALLATMILFLIPNIFLGAILPYALKIKTNNIKNSGKTNGIFYALGAIGSVFGTFLTAFVLIPHLSYMTTLFISASLLIVLGSLWHKEHRIYLLGIIAVLLICYFGRNITYIPVFSDNMLSVDGSVVIDRTKMKLIDDVVSQYSRIQIYDAFDEKAQKPMRIMRVNHEMHSGSYLDSDYLVFEYARYNRLGGHFNPDATTALLIGGGGYSYAKFFLGDTPLFDQDKKWSLDGKIYDNGGKVTVPIILSTDPKELAAKRKLIYQATSTPVGAEIEGTKNFIDAQNQVPNAEVLVDKAEINETGMPCETGYVHVHETKEDGKPGEVISSNYYLHEPRGIIGHSDEIAGSNKDVEVKLDRAPKNGETVYVMLHRDNCNHRFDPIETDGYENMQKLDVVEIDPMTTELAKKYFGLIVDDPRLHIYHEDGRTYINDTKNKYDIIYVDAFRSFYSVPFQLSTKESAQKLYDILNPNGVVVFNIPSALGGTMGKSFQAEYKTLSQVFPHLKAYGVTDPKNETIVQSIIIVAFKSTDSPRTFPNDNPEINDQLKHEWTPHLEPGTPILTDDFAPVDYFINKLIDIPTM
ncbi:MAG: fused MFS/spermidine synthase [Patescibacteria group bacterium]